MTPVDAYGNHYRSWSEMKSEGIEIETMQEYIDEVRGFNDYEPDFDDRDDPAYGREYDETYEGALDDHTDN